MIRRHRKTLKLVERFIPKHSQIYDLGKENPMSKIMNNDGYFVSNNTNEVDFNKCQKEIIKLSKAHKYTTSFEVFEHILNLYAVLNAIKSDYMLCTVPLKVFFSNAYWGKDKHDQHYHEFEQRQFLWILEETGWEVIEKGTWTFTDKIGLRPIFRLFFPSYIYVYLKRKQ